MTPERAGLVREHWDGLRVAAPQVADAFARRLLELDPQARALLGARSGEALADPLAQAITAVVARLESPEELIPELSRLGRRLQERGITERTYDLLGDALLSALGTTSGTGWHGELQDAWLEAYTFVASIMKRAGQRVSGATAIVAG